MDCKDLDQDVLILTNNDKDRQIQLVVGTPEGGMILTLIPNKNEKKRENFVFPDHQFQDNGDGVCKGCYRTKDIGNHF